MQQNTERTETTKTGTEVVPMLNTENKVNIEIPIVRWLKEKIVPRWTKAPNVALKTNTWEYGICARRRN